MEKDSIQPAYNTRHGIAVVEKGCKLSGRVKSRHGTIQRHSLKFQDMHKSGYQWVTKMKINLDNLTLHNRFGAF